MPSFRTIFYVLDRDNHPVQASMEEWGKHFENTTNRIVGSTQINSKINVSTVFLGMDHRFHGDGPPILFETMIFGGELDSSTWRYSSWDDAEIGHKAAVRKARKAVNRNYTNVT